MMTVDHVARSVQMPRFTMLAKLGYAARGVVFLLVASLALFSGFATSGTDTKSAVSLLMEQPFGRIWVGIIGLGLLGFVAWRLAQSFADTDGHGRSGKAMIIRAALLGSAVTYSSLALYALGHALMAGGDEGSGEKGLAGWIMSQPFGSYLAFAVGLGFIIGGMVTAYKGLTRKFEKYITIPADKSALSWLCIYGLVARGVVFAVTGLLFAFAAYEVDPDQAGNMTDAMEWLRQLPFGQTIYVVIAVGLAAFGVYNLVAARYRTVKGPDLSKIKGAVPRMR